MNLKDHEHDLQVQYPNLNNDLVLENANPNQINSIVTLMILLKMLGKYTNSKQYYQRYCEEQYGILDNISCQAKVAQDMTTIGLHFTDPMELFDAKINHIRT